jgi:adenylate cyclase
MEEKAFKRKLTAILSADAVGYSRLMNDDEEATVRTLQSYRKVFSTLIVQHNGRLIDSPGDNLLAEFASVVDGLRCALAVQHELANKNTALSENRRMHFRIGLNLGDVIEEKGRLYGDGVNVAARLESLAEPGGIHFSGAVYDQVKNKLPNRFEFTGDQQVKNIPEPLKTYRVVMDSETDSLQKKTEFKKKHLKTVLIFLLGTITIWVVGLGWHYWQAKNSQTTSNISPESSVSPPPAFHKASIAVLPFKNLSDDVEQEYFSDGITNDIITDLSKFRELLVIASNTVFLYKGKTVNIKNVGQELGVAYIMEGSVQKAGDNVRINAQLINASDGTHVWAERYHRTYTDIFELQGDIVQAIVAKLAIKTFQYEQARALRKKPNDLLAYDYLLRGSAYYHQRNRSAYARAKEMFSRAVDLDPFYAAAYVGLGEVEYGKVGYGWTEFPDKALKKALELGQKAIELDESNSTAHSLLSSIYTFQNKYELAINEAERAIELNPNDSGSYNELGWALLWSGQLDEAIAALDMSLRLDSSSPRNIWFHLGIAYYLKEEFGKASVILAQGLTKRPGFSGYHIALAATYARLGRNEDAAREAAAVRRSDPFFKVGSFGTGFRQAAHRQAIATGLREAGLE